MSLALATGRPVREWMSASETEIATALELLAADDDDEGD